MRRSRTLIGLTAARAAAQLHQCTLQSTLQRQVRLTVAESCRLPIGVGQYDMHQQMLQLLASDLDLQAIAVHPVQLETISRLVFLAEKQLRFRSVTALPGSYPSLKATSLLAGGIFPPPPPKILQKDLCLSLLLPHKDPFSPHPHISTNLPRRFAMINYFFPLPT